MRAPVIKTVPLIEAVEDMPAGQSRWRTITMSVATGAATRGVAGGRLSGTSDSYAGIVDVYDACTSDRVYGKATIAYEALRYIHLQRGSHFDEEVVLRFIQCMVGSCVQMNTRHFGLVISVHPDLRLKPTVLSVLDAEGRRYAVPMLIDLLTQGVAAQSAPLEVHSVVSPTQHEIDVRKHVAQTVSLVRAPPD
jgi:hypothetical protein